MQYASSTFPSYKRKDRVQALMWYKRAESVKISVHNIAFEIISFLGRWPLKKLPTIAIEPN